MNRFAISTIAASTLAVAAAIGVASSGSAAQTPQAQSLATYSVLHQATAADPAAVQFAKDQLVWFSTPQLNPVNLRGVSVASAGVTVGLTTDGASICVAPSVADVQGNKGCVSLPTNPNVPPLLFGQTSKGIYAVTVVPDSTKSITVTGQDGETESAAVTQNVGIAWLTKDKAPATVSWTDAGGVTKSFRIPTDIDKGSIPQAN